MKPDMRELLTLLFGELIPFNRYLGIELTTIEAGNVRLDLPFKPDLIGNPERPALHGGVISALLDTAGGMAVWTNLDLNDRVATVDLRVDYLRPGRAERLVGIGRVVRTGNHVGVCELRAFHPSAPEKPIAAGMGVYNIYRPRVDAGQPDLLSQLRKWQSAGRVPDNA